MRKKFMEGFKKFTAMFVLIQMVMVLFPGSVAAATSIYSPSWHGKGDQTHQFTNGDRAFTQDDTGSVANQQDSEEVFGNYGINLPASSTITKVNVSTRAMQSQGMDGARLFVSVSSDAGVSWSTATDCGSISEAGFTTTSCNNGTWGRLWNVDELSDTNFKVKVRASYDGSWASNKIWLDWIPVTVEYQENVQATYSVIYDGNGNDAGSVPNDPGSPYNSGDMVTILGNTGGLLKTGYTFVGWNTAADGLGSPYVVGSKFTITNHTTLYARWILTTTHNVMYDGNGSDAGIVPTDTNSPYITGDTVTVLDNTSGLSKTGHSFVGWNTLADGFGDSYVVGSTFTITNHTTLYAQWSVNQYTITFDSTGGTLIDPIIQGFGTLVAPPVDPTREGYVFDGWSPAVPLTMPGENITLVAQWILDTTLIDAPTTTPIVLTPATPVIAAVAGEFAEAAEEQDVSSETTDDEEGEILGEEDEEEDEERCDWWWILSIILAIVLGGNYLLAKKYHDRENIRKVLMVTPVGFGLLTLYAHQVLGDGLKHVPWCYYLWLIVAVLVAAYYLIKNYLGKKETSK